MDAKTVTLEVHTPEQAELLRNFHAYVLELDQLALSAPDGKVVDECELSAVTKGQDITRQALEQAVQRRINAAEKKGRR
jgi:predicted RNA-binding protein associated with RNAse of E/G family